MLPEHHVAVSRRQDTAGDGGLGSDVDLPPARGSPELLDAIGEDRGPRPARTDVAATRKDGHSSKEIERGKAAHGQNGGVAAPPVIGAGHDVGYLLSRPRR